MTFVFCPEGCKYLICSSLGTPNFSCARTRDNFVLITLHGSHEKKRLTKITGKS